MNKNLFTIYRNSKEYEVWPLKEEVFLSTIYGEHKNDINNKTAVFEDKVDGRLVGYISCKVRDSKGVISFIFVTEEFRLKGIGSKLLKQGIDWLKANGAKEVVFGAGSGSYIFPGLPKNLKIEGFFEKNGFKATDDGLVDMFQDITNWEVSEDIFKETESVGVKIQFSDEESANKIVEFAKENFSNWYEYFKQDMEKGKYDKVFYASIGDEVVGISKLWVGDCTWDLLFENNVGGGGALGVSEKHRGKGIGLAMKAWGTKKIKDRGIKYVWIGWTYAIDFYKKLGFEVWREYFKTKLII